MKTFILPLLLSLFVEVICFSSQDDMSDLGLIKYVEEAAVLAIEPWGIERRHLKVMSRQEVERCKRRKR